MLTPETTVLFATHNGSSTLPTMLEAFTRLEPPPGGWQIVAVDNASTDSTGEVLSRYQSRLPLIILSQPARGKNKALNTAIPALAGDLIVFTDDDVIPECRKIDTAGPRKRAGPIELEQGMTSSYCRSDDALG